MANCNSLNYKGQTYTQDEFLRYVKEHPEEFSQYNTSDSDMSVGQEADIILPIGTSGSGKSTWIKSINATGKFTVISPDEMRVEFTGDINDKSKDDEIYQAVNERVISAVRDGRQVIVDTTNLKKDRRRFFIEEVKRALPDAKIQYKLMPLNAELAKQRIRADIKAGVNRADVPDSTIDRHAESYREMLEDIKSEDMTNYDDSIHISDDISDDLSEDDLNNVKPLPFKIPLAKVLAGTKRLLVLPMKYDLGTYRVKNKLINLVPMNRNKLTLPEYLDILNMGRSSFVKTFISSDETESDEVKAFLAGNLEMYLYGLEHVTEADSILPTMDDKRFLNVYDSKKRLIEKTEQQLRNEPDPTKREVLNDRIFLLQQQMRALEDDENRTINTITAFMDNDIQTVEHVLNNNPDLASLEYAQHLLFNYVNLVTVDFRDLVDTLPVETRANITRFVSNVTDLMQRIKTEFLTRPARLVKELTGTEVLLDGMVIEDKETIGKIGRFTKDTTENVNDIVQTLTKTIKTAIEHLNLRYTSFLSKHQKLVKDLLKYQNDNGVKKANAYDFMVQVDDAGLKTGFVVDRNSAAYYRERLDTHASEEVEAILNFYAQDHNLKINDKAWDVREKSLIEYFKTHRYDEVILSESDMAKGIEFSEKLEKAAQAYALKRNPYTAKRIIEKYRTDPTSVDVREKGSFMTFVKSGMYYEKVDGVKMQPLELIPTGRWIDPKYSEIQSMSATDPRKVFYDHFMANLVKGREAVSIEDFYLPWNYIPEKSKRLPIGGNLKEWLKDRSSQFITDNFAQSISENEQVDPFTLEVSKKIPRYMTAGNLHPDDKSYDLGDVLGDFMREVMNFEEKKAIEDDTNLLLMLLKEQPIVELAPDGSKKVNPDGSYRVKEGLSVNYLMSLYRVNAQLYDEKQDRESVSKFKRMDVATKKRVTEIEAKLAAIEISPEDKEKALELFHEDMPYVGNKLEIADYISLLNQRKAIKGNVKYLSGNKAANSLMFYTSIKALGFNIFGGIAEMLQGLTSLFMESASRTFFTDNDAMSSFGEMIMNLNPFSDGPREIRNFSKYFGAQGKVYQDSDQSNGLSKLAFLQYEKAGYFINTTFLLSFLRGQRIKDVDGKEHTLRDALTIDDYGNFSWKDGFNIAEKLHEENGRHSQYLIDLIHRFKEVIKNNRDRQASDDPIEMEKSMIGRMLGQFKKNWLFRAYTIRFGEARKADKFSGQEAKGFYRSFWDMILDSVPTKINEFGEEERDMRKALTAVPYALLSNFIKFSVFGKMLGYTPKEGEFSKIDEANLRRFMRETSFIITLMITVLILTSGDGDDDRDGARRYFTNQLIRLQRDMTTYMSPNSFASLFKNPAPVIGTFTDLFRIGDAMVKSTVLGDPYIYEGTDRQALRIWQATEKNIPIINQIDKIRNKIDKITMYNTY
jgi:predicted kinase